MNMASIKDAGAALLLAWSVSAVLSGYIHLKWDVEPRLWFVVLGSLVVTLLHPRHMWRARHESGASPWRGWLAWVGVFAVIAGITSITTHNASEYVRACRQRQQGEVESLRQAYQSALTSTGSCPTQRQLENMSRDSVRITGHTCVSAKEWSFRWRGVVFPLDEGRCEHQTTKCLVTERFYINYM